jgi:magnesium transporter
MVQIQGGLDKKTARRQDESRGRHPGSMDARASIVGNNLNGLMKRLNLITIGIMVPTLVVSAFSMNVGILLAKHPNAFWMIIGLAAASVIGFMIFWRRKGS